MGGLNSQEITFPIDADSVHHLGIAWGPDAPGAMGQEHLLLLVPWALET